MLESYGHCGGVAQTLRRLPVGTPVSVGIDGSGYVRTTFRFLRNREAVFSGGAFGATGFVALARIRGLRLGESSTSGLLEAAAGHGPVESAEGADQGAGYGAGAYGAAARLDAAGGRGRAGLAGGGAFARAHGDDDPRRGGGGRRGPMAMLGRLAPGTPVEVWFASSGFLRALFQFRTDDEAVFSGGDVGDGLTYVRAADICAVKLPILPQAASTGGRA